MRRGFCGNGSKGSLLPPSLILIICARRIARLRGIGLAKTCTKHGISFWNYLGARLNLPGAAVPPQLGRQTQPAHRQDLIQSLEDALRDAGSVALEALGEIADQLLRLRRVVEFPGLAQYTPDRGMQSRR